MGEVLHDEDLLAQPDEAEFASRDRFDGRGVLGQQPSLLPEARILGSLQGNRAGKLVVLTAGTPHRNQPALANDPVDDENEGDEEQQRTHDSPGPRGRFGADESAFPSGAMMVTRHEDPDSTTTGPESTSQSRQDMTDVVLVLTTVSSADLGESIATALVNERLAACVSVSAPMTSVYRWKGAVEHETERQLVIKTTRDQLSTLQTRIAALHPYEVPELLVLDASGGSSRYLDWIRDETQSG
jgi:periplasmic divalent cation tolerance protein